MKEGMKKRKQAFYEVGGGKFSEEAQAQFEEIQTLAMESRQPITMTMKIAVEPPADGDRFGKTQFFITHTMPTTKSIKFTTEYEQGFAIKDGESVCGLLQTSLELKENNH